MANFAIFQPHDDTTSMRCMLERIGYEYVLKKTVDGSGYTIKSVDKQENYTYFNPQLDVVVSNDFVRGTGWGKRIECNLNDFMELLSGIRSEDDESDPWNFAGDTIGRDDESLSAALPTLGVTKAMKSLDRDTDERDRGSPDQRTIKTADRREKRECNVSTPNRDRLARYKRPAKGTIESVESKQRDAQCRASACDEGHRPCDIFRPASGVDEDGKSPSFACDPKARRGYGSSSCRKSKSQKDQRERSSNATDDTTQRSSANERPTHRHPLDERT